MSSYKEWLYAQLVNDDVIDDDDYTVEDLTKETLLTETDVDESDLENYESDFADYCRNNGVEPEWDLDEV